MEPVILDRDHLSQYTHGDSALEEELFDLLAGQLRQCLAKMEAAEDADDWTVPAHTLKGAARGVGAFRLARACEDAEAMVRSQLALEVVREAARDTLEAMDRVDPDKPV